MFAHGPTAAAKPGEPLERSLLAAAGAVAAALVALCGIVLAARRLSGGFGPAGGGAVVAVAALGGLLVVLVDAAARLSGLPAAWRAAARAGYALAWTAVGLPARGTSAIDALCFLVATGVAAAVVAGPLMRLPRGPALAGLSLRLPRRPRSRPDGLNAAPPRSATRAAAAAPAVDVCPGQLRQRFERYELDGIDCLRGTLALTVPQGSRSGHGHVGFCPAFRQIPHVEATTEYDGVEAVVTAAEIVPWGVRIECRLDEPAEEPVEIPVDVVARAPA